MEDFTAILISDSPRAADWIKVFGGLDVHLKSPFPIRANLPGAPNALIYELDLELIAPDVRQRLIEHLAFTFQIPMDEVAAQLDKHGCPIKAEDVIVSVKNPVKWLL